MAQYQTGQKRMLLAYMKAHSEEALTIEEWCRRLQAEPALSSVPGKSTVYRMMPRLVEEGLVRRFVKENSRKFLYQMVCGEHCDRHLHMKCSVCGKLYHMEDEDSEEPPAVCGCTEKCQAGAINRNCPVCAFTMTSCTGKAAEPEEPPAMEPEPEKKSGMNPAVLLLVVALLGGGGALYYFKFMKNKPKTKGTDNLDDYDYGDEEDELWESEEGAEEEPEESEEEPE